MRKKKLYLRKENKRNYSILTGKKVKLNELLHSIYYV